MRAHFDESRLCKPAVHGIGRAEELHRRSHTDRRHVFGLDLGRTDHKHVIGLGCNVERVTRVDQAHWAVQRDLGRVDSNDLTAYSAQTGPVGAPAQTTAVKYPTDMIMKVRHFSRAVPMGRDG